MAYSKNQITNNIIESYGVISEPTKGFFKELNLVSWNGSKPKYDIRDWSADHQKLSKGITLTAEELIALRDILNKIEIK